MFGHHKSYRKKRSRKSSSGEIWRYMWWLVFFPGVWPVMIIFWLVGMAMDASDVDFEDWFHWNPKPDPKQSRQPIRQPRSPEQPRRTPILVGAKPVQKRVDPRTMVKLPTTCAACGAPTGTGIVEWQGTNAYCAYCDSKIA